MTENEKELEQARHRLEEAEPLRYERASKYPKSTKYGRQNPICTERNSDEQLLKWRKA